LPFFSVLDLSPILQGSDASAALRNTLDLAQHAERWGYRRVWLAEHHNMPGIASAATAVLPNHAPLVIAEQFGTLEALYPGRIDLGLGRAPGTDMLTARALRRDAARTADSFPEDVVELMSYFREASAGQAVRAVPGAGLQVPVWILGSSLFGAQLAAHLGLPYAFASHFAPADLDEAVRLYRRTFRPSASLKAPYVMLGLNVFAAETDREAGRLATSLQQAFVALRRGMPARLPPPVDSMDGLWTDLERAQLGQVFACSVVGAPETVRRGLEAFVNRNQPDEIMVTSQTFDHGARLRSFEIVSEVTRIAA
jgi:luciferase family oxidoreductase group 1